MRVAIRDACEILYEGAAKAVILPGEDGELSILDSHQPFLYRLREGNVRILGTTPQQAASTPPAQSERCIAIQDGVARMTGDELVLLVEISGRRTHA